MTMNTMAVILRREDWNGDDCRITLYTKDRGKLEAVARGLRKAKSKLSAHLQPLALSEVFLVEGKRFPIVAGSSVACRYPRIMNSLSSMSTGGLMARLVDLMTPLESHESRIYELLTDALGILEATDQHDDRINHLLARLFAWKLLALSGYHAQLRECVECGKTMTEQETDFGVRRGGVIHRACSPVGEHTLRVSLPAIKGLAYMVDAPLTDAARLRSQNGALGEMMSIIEALVEERFEVGAGGPFWRLPSLP